MLVWPESLADGGGRGVGGVHQGWHLSGFLQMEDAGSSPKSRPGAAPKLGWTSGTWGPAGCTHHSLASGDEEEALSPI